MLIIILIGNLVFQSGDTLKFYKNDTLMDQWIIKTSEETESGSYYIQKAKVSPDNKKFLFYEEKYFPAKDSIYTKLTLYGANRKKIWTKIRSGVQKICFDLTHIYTDRVTLLTTNLANASPIMEIIKGNKTTRKIDLTQWTSIVDYEISPNDRYVLFHAKKPYNSRLWDYIYFIDLKTNKTWEYLFPLCFSCKRGRIDLKVNDDGKSEAIYKNEHRIFDRDGNLVDIFVKMD